MTRKIFAAILLAFVLLFVTGGPARADELCPGCYGKGRVGCGQCLSSGLGAFIGKCHTCCGFYARTLIAGERCPTCHGSQICPGCDGKGVACMVCKGTGKVPNGTAKAVADGRAKDQRDGLEKNIKKRLEVLVGRWKGTGEDTSQGKFSTEMRWTRVLDDSFLRHEERIQYEAGGVVEYVSYMTWLEADKQYVWLLLFSPGKGLQIRGTPSADGTVITWELVLESGATLRSVWNLHPSEKRLETTTTVSSDEGPRKIGSTSSARTAGDPGAALVTGTSSRAEGDPATDALLAGLKPLEFLLGKWTGTAESAGGALKSQSWWGAVLGGTVYETEALTTNPDGSKTRMRGALSWDANERKLTLVTLQPGGEIQALKGTVGSTEGGGQQIVIELAGGARLVWAVPEGGKRIDWFVDVPTESGDRKVVEKGVDSKE